jgi:hypothetical protein
MACDIAIHDREAVFRKTWATGACPDDALVQRGFEGPTTIETYLIRKLTGLLAGLRLLDNASCLTKASVDFAPRGVGGTALGYYIYLPKSNNLHGTRRCNSQPTTHPADTTSTVESPPFQADGDSL